MAAFRDTQIPRYIEAFPALLVAEAARFLEQGRAANKTAWIRTFRAYVRDLGFEVASGGRYDGLPAAFGEDVPAVGFTFILDRLEQIATPNLEAADIDGTPINVEQGFAKALELRQAGKAVKLCL